MEKKSIWSLLQPYLVALVVFMAVNVLYFAPQFRGEVLPQHDIKQYKGMAQEVIQHREAFGEDPQWAGSMFSGMPAYLINVKYDGTVIRQISKALYFLGDPASLIFLAMASFFFMLLCLGINPWVGMISALAYGFSTYFFVIIGAGHITKMVALAFAPICVGGVFLAYRRNIWMGAALTGIFGSLLIAANHPQITYYFLIVLLFYWISTLVKAYKERALAHFARVTGVLMLSGVLAVGSNAGMLYYIQSHSAQTMRGGSELSPPAGDSVSGGKTATKNTGLDLEYATAWSYGKTETLNLLIPDLYGGSSEGGFGSNGEVARSLEKYNARDIATQLPAYWGEQPITSGPVYVGAVALFLAVLALFLLGGACTAWIVAVSVLAILLSWGHNLMWFTELFFNYFPMYNKFRTVSMILVIVEWCVPLLGAMVLQRIWMGEVSRVQMIRALKYTLILLGGVTLLFGLFGSSLISFAGASDAQMPADVAQAMRAERADMMRADALRSLFLVLFAAAAVWFFQCKTIKRGVFVAVMVGLVMVDMVPVNLRYLGQRKFVAPVQNQIKPTQADLQILEDKEPGFRVINFSVNPFSDATTSYFHRSVGGYHGAKLQRYQDLIERQLAPMNWESYHMLNTKYIISRDEKSGQLMVQQNPRANGAAWFVDRVCVVPTADAAMASLDTLHTLSEAVVEADFAPALAGVGRQEGACTLLPGDTAATIRLTEYRSNLQMYSYSAASQRIAIFSEVYYADGWTAYVDGVEAPYFRADYLLRAMVLPAGEHTVEFRFRAPHYQTLTSITWISSLLLLLGLVAAGGVTYYKKRKNG